MTVCFFPNKDMFINIASLASPRMAFFVDKDITISVFNPSTFPTVRIFANSLIKYFRVKFPPLFQITTMAPLGVIFYSLATIRTQRSYCSSFVRTFFAPSGIGINRFTTIRARMFFRLSRLSCTYGVWFNRLLFHIVILLYTVSNNKRIVSRFADVDFARRALNSALDFRPRKGGDK